MILDALVNQFVQRFQHEKRARVCLWFDERREFIRLLPALREHLAAMTHPPFRFLEYDEEQRRGQIWLKYEIRRALNGAGPAERNHLRFVAYVPLSEDRLERAGTDGEAPLDLLAEYRLAGILWRVGGKRPTLFSFLRQAGVSLPDGPSEQRRLYEGGADSLLAKYAAKFVDRPAVFWSIPLTPGLAQSRLIGDADQIILDLAVDPEVAWKSLRDKGLAGELVEIVRERYGFEAPAASPGEWVRDLVAVLALTETFLGYGEPRDFPFMDRLPDLTLRPHHVQLLQRWLRDSNSRAAWDCWVQEVETKIDLSAWARGRPGLSFGFPHLVRLRWDDVWEAFEQAAPKASATVEFFDRCQELIANEANLGKTSHAAIGRWSLLRDLGVFVHACGDGEARVGKVTTVADLARAYVDAAPTIELQHIRIRYRAEEHNLPAAIRVADRAYADYANALNTRFFPRLMAEGTAAVPGLPDVTPHLEQRLWHAKGRRAVVIVDALRYDCAFAIKEVLREEDVGIEPVVAMLPTVTPIGMTALLPLSGASVGLQMKSNSLHPTVNGKDTSALSNRIAYLEAFGATCLDIADAEAAGDAPHGAGDLLVVFGHDDVDHIGHGEAQTLIRHVQLEVDRLTRLIRKLHRWGYATVHVVTDHGFVLLDEARLPEEVLCDKDWCHARKERFAIVPAAADLPVATFPFRWDDRVKVAVPPGLAFFKTEKSFSHGGAALQEIIIPHLTSKSRATTQKRVGVEVVLPTCELMRTAVKVVLRPRSTVAAGGQMLLFAETGRTLALDVQRPDATRRGASVLATGPKELRVEPRGKEQAVTLFFHTAASFHKGELLDLDIRDADTMEQFPPGGIKLTVGRDM
ncbi:MAG: PglZ domain-containing protein [Candidatus Schekmanbacteria bacterium]|nr:PglZ domain-containing protein [Candidatus Schekmanbacteria bacterium]